MMALYQQGEPESAPLRCEEREIAPPGPGEVALEVLACGVCHTDLHIVRGDLPLRRAPIVPGHQIVGRVIACGAGVDVGLQGARVGVPWLSTTCGKCRQCGAGRENLCERATHLGKILLKEMESMEQRHPIIGEVRGLGCLLGIELVKDKGTRAPFEEAGRMIYQKAFRKGLAWIPSGHILRMSPPLIMEDELALKGLAIIEEAIYETERELGY